MKPPAQSGLATPIRTPDDNPPALTLTANGYQVKGQQRADLSWSSSGDVVIYRNDVQIEPLPVTGISYTGYIGKKSGSTYSYKVCLSASPDISRSANPIPGNESWGKTTRWKRMTRLLGISGKGGKTEHVNPHSMPGLTSMNASIAASWIFLDRHHVGPGRNSPIVNRLHPVTVATFS